MKRKIFQFEYEEFNTIEQITNPGWVQIIETARDVTAMAYAPYSMFNVGAAALLSNGEIITGTNQENASYPVAICAERVLLSVAAVLHPSMPIEAMAVSYKNIQPETGIPISPCGMCRQAIYEYEQRVARPIKMILTAQTGRIIVLGSISHLLPLAFDSKTMA